MKVYKLFGATVQMKPIPFSAFYKLKLGKVRLNYDSGQLGVKGLNSQDFSILMFFLYFTLHC